MSPEFALHHAALCAGFTPARSAARNQPGNLSYQPPVLQDAHVAGALEGLEPDIVSKPACRKSS